MAKSSKKPEAKQENFWCECECANCEMSPRAPHSPKCHMAKWQDVKGKPSKPNR